MTNAVDIIIPFHNGLNTVIDCLDAIIRFTRTGSYRLLLIDDNSDRHTHDYIQKWADDTHQASVFTNARHLGYLKSANSGIGQGTAPFIVLMQSDVVVTQGWLDRMVACAETDNDIALVMPLVSADPRNGLPLPPGVSFVFMDEYVQTRFCGRTVDTVPQKAGCMLIRRSVVEKTGLFDNIYDQKTFGQSDLGMRLITGGFRTVLTCDTYVYQKGRIQTPDQTPNYGRDQAIFHSRWGATFHRKYKQFLKTDPLKPIRDGLGCQTRWDLMPVIWQTGRSMLTHVREKKWLDAAYQGFWGAMKLASAKRRLPPPVFEPLTGKRRCLRVTYILHNLVVAGGVLSVIQIVNELILLGIDAKIVALFQDPAVVDWARLYNEPIVFKNPQELLDRFPLTDIVVATLWTTASLADQLVRQGKAAQSAYFLQDYEPWFFPESDRVSRRRVQQTYARISHRIVKSRWLAGMLAKEGYHTHQIRLGLNLGVFYPRNVDRNHHPVVLAMARPKTPRRGFAPTIAALANVKHQMPDVEIVLFGDRFLKRMAIPFEFRDEGVVTSQDRMAELYSEATVFLDGSDFQGFGRCGLEAMACGAACVLTGAGGVTEYAVHDHNSLIVPPKRPDLFSEAILTLLKDKPLRNRLIDEGLQTAGNFCHKREARETYEFFRRLHE
ncbi:MAG: glycosyltransferase [Desulfatirhabdiaceae bacterium]